MQYNHRDFPMMDGENFGDDATRRNLQVPVTIQNDNKKYQCIYYDQANNDSDAEGICSDCAFLHVIHGMKHLRLLYCQCVPVNHFFCTCIHVQVL